MSEALRQILMVGGGSLLGDYIGSKYDPKNEVTYNILGGLVGYLIYDYTRPKNGNKITTINI